MRLLVQHLHMLALKWSTNHLQALTVAHLDDLPLTRFFFFFLVNLFSRATMIEVSVLDLEGGRAIPSYPEPGYRDIYAQAH